MPHPVRKRPDGTYGNRSLTNVGAAHKNGAGISAHPQYCRQRGTRSAFDDVDDLMRLRAYDDIAAVHQDYLEATPFRIDLDDPPRNRVEADIGRHGRADGNVKVHVGGLFDLLRL